MHKFPLPAWAVTLFGLGLDIMGNLLQPTWPEAPHSVFTSIFVAGTLFAVVPIPTCLIWRRLNPAPALDEWLLELHDLRDAGVTLRNATHKVDAANLGDWIKTIERWWRTAEKKVAERDQVSARFIAKIGTYESRPVLPAGNYSLPGHRHFETMLTELLDRLGKVIEKNSGGHQIVADPTSVVLLTPASSWTIQPATTIPPSNMPQLVNVHKAKDPKQ